MIACFIPLFYILSGLFIVNDSLVKLTTITRTLAKLDKKIGDKSEELCISINTALAMNVALRTMHATCTAAMYTGTFPAMEAAANLIRLEQDLLLFEARLSMQTLPFWEFSKSLNPPERGSGGACGLPDVLECRNKNVFSIKHDSDSEPGGAKAEASGVGMNCTEVKWWFEDSRVKPLP